MKKVLLLLFVITLLTGCTNKPSNKDLIEASNAISELYIDTENPVTTIQAYIFSEYTSTNGVFFSNDDMLFSPDLLSHFMSLHMEWGYFPSEENMFYNLKEINPNNKSSFSYENHKIKFTVSDNLVKYTVSGGDVSIELFYDTEIKEILGVHSVWEDIYDWIDSGDINPENNSIRYIDGNMIAMMTKFSQTYIYIMDNTNEILYYYKVERDYDTRVSDIRIFRIPYNDFMISKEFPSNPGNNDVWIKTKSLPSILEDWSEFIKDDDNIINRIGQNGPYTYLIDNGNNFNEVITLFDTYFGEDTSDTMWSQPEDIGPRFNLKESEVTINQVDIESYDFYGLIDPISSPEYFYPEEFIVTITHSLTSSTSVGIYTVIFDVNDSQGNTTTKELTVTIQ